MGSFFSDSGQVLAQTNIGEKTDFIVSGLHTILRTIGLRLKPDKALYFAINFYVRPLPLHLSIKGLFINDATQVGGGVHPFVKLHIKA